MPRNPLSMAVGVALAPARIAGRAASGLLREVTGGGRKPDPVRYEPPVQAPPKPRPVAAPSRQRARPKDLDDVAIARKVESIIFRDRKVAKGKIDVNVADGVVWLRGEARTPDLIKKLEAMALEVPEVNGVENLLHLPKTPAPTRTDTPAAQRKTRRSKPKPSARKVTPARVTEEAPAPPGTEPSPRETSEAGKGRQPAPLGSRDKDDDTSPEAS